MVKLHRLIGHLPMVLHPNPEARAGRRPGRRRDARRRQPARRPTCRSSSSPTASARAPSFFRHVNYDLLNRPNVRLRVDDGRNFLSLTRDRFDVATADLIQPIHAGAGNLYSREYFTLVRDALADGGLVLQWIGHRPETQYKLIMRTFLEVFPHTTLWLDGQLMVGSLAPLTLSPDLVQRKRARPETRLALDEVGLDSFETLTSWYLAGPDELRRFVGAGSAADRRSAAGRIPPVAACQRPARRSWRGCGATSAAHRAMTTRCRAPSTPCSSTPAVCSCIRTGRASPPRSSTAASDERAALAAAEPHAKREMDLGTLMARTDDRQRGWILLRLRAAPRRPRRRDAGGGRGPGRGARVPRRAQRVGARARRRRADAGGSARARRAARRGVERQRPAARDVRSRRPHAACRRHPRLA